MPHSGVLTAALDGRGVAYELLEHPRTDRAADEAAVLGLEPRDVAKTIVVSRGEGHVRVVLPASERIDMRKLRDFLAGGKELQLLTEEDMERAYPDFELGAVPPLGGPEDEVVVDRRVAERGSVVFEAGSHSSSIKVATSDLVAAAHGRVADVCED